MSPNSRVSFAASLFVCGLLLAVVEFSYDVVRTVGPVPNIVFAGLMLIIGVIIFVEAFLALKFVPRPPDD